MAHIDVLYLELKRVLSFLADVAFLAFHRLKRQLFTCRSVKRARDSRIKFCYKRL